MLEKSYQHRDLLDKLVLQMHIRLPVVAEDTLCQYVGG
jgi:hypothetical protein